MARVLVIGIDPDLVDFSDPALPPGMNADIVRSGIRSCLDDLKAAGYQPVHLYVSPDPKDPSVLADRLAGEAFDCIAIGGGVRLPPRNLLLFEAILNTVARAKSRPAIALAARPEEVAAAVSRALGRR